MRYIHVMDTQSTNQPAPRKRKVTKRAPGKRKIGFYATEQEKAGLLDAARDRGISLAELLRRIALDVIPLVNEEDA